MDPPREESSGNFGAILAVLCASIAGLPVPFAPVHLLFINLLTDSLPAIALGMEPHRSEVMNEKPRSADESILTKDFLSKIGLEGFVIGAMTMIEFLTGYHQNGALLGSTYAFEFFALLDCFMDSTANQIIRSFSQKYSSTINGCREHLYLVAQLHL